MFDDFHLKFIQILDQKKNNETRKQEEDLITYRIQEEKEGGVEGLSDLFTFDSSVFISWGAERAVSGGLAEVIGDGFPRSASGPFQAEPPNRKAEK